ncbi:MAG TPA: hypothetical protein VFC47_10715 [Caulobacteraceae bacterium]|nr:hypothetical protein [Caulobacteraceae bacterium]
MTAPSFGARASSPHSPDSAEKSGLEGRAPNREAADLARKSAYIDSVRALYRGTRNAGFVACLLGTLILVGSRYMAGVPGWGVYLGAAVIAVGWALFVVSVFKRAAWVRAHPFDANGRT